MKQLYLISQLKDYFSQREGLLSDIAVINLDERSSSKGRKSEGIEYFPLVEIKNKDEFDREYIDLTAALGEKRSSMYWWASSLSEKNPLLSKLFGRLYKLVCLEKTLQANPDKDFVLMSEDNVLKEQIYRNYENSYDVRYSRKSRFLYTLGHFLSTMLGIIKQISKASSEYRYLLSARTKINININTNKTYVVLRSWLDGRSYVNGKYEDSYFKELPEELSKNKKNVLIFAGIISNPDEIFSLIKDDIDNIIIPYNYYLKGIDIVKALLISLFCRPSVKGTVFCHNCLITHLIGDELYRDCKQTLFFNAILNFYACKRLAEAISIEKFIYTYENYAWEKMGILGIRAQKPEINIVGFQHAFISKNSFKYFPGKGEETFAPYPNHIVTMGKKTAEIMQRLGHYPDKIFKTGCALRQNYLTKMKKLMRDTGKGIFIPLTITVEDSVKVIQFIQKAGLGETDDKVFLRFHPVTRVEEVLNKCGFDLPENFIISENPPMSEEFKRCSVVLYSWTTVCLEALYAGKPVIYLDVNFPYEVDPLFECESKLIRRCRKPKSLQNEIKVIREMELSDYQEELEHANNYLKDYLFPVSEEGYLNFIS